MRSARTPRVQTLIMSLAPLCIYIENHVLGTEKSKPLNNLKDHCQTMKMTKRPVLLRKVQGVPSLKVMFDSILTGRNMEIKST